MSPELIARAPEGRRKILKRCADRKTYEVFQSMRKPTLTRLLLRLASLFVLSGTAQAEVATSVSDFIAATGVREGPIATRTLPGWRANPTILVRADRRLAIDAAADFPDARIIVVANREEALELAAEADVIMGYCDAELVRAAVRLVWVQIYSAGAERCLGVDAIRSGRVLLTNMQKMSSPAIGEHAIAMVLSLTRGLPRFAKAMPAGEWRRDLARSPDMVTVRDKTLLVAGLGGIGRQVAMRAKALGMRVTATRNSSREGPGYVDYIGLSDELAELAGDADVVVNALPLTAETSGLFGDELFAAMKPGAFFINVGRGGTVITADLLAALESGHLAGAGLDVTAPEPLPAEHPLWQMPNVIITPHLSARGSDMAPHALLGRENIRRYLAGEALLNVVDPARGY